MDDSGPPVSLVTERAEQQSLAALQRSGLFDGAWFLARNPDLRGTSHAALVHWHRYGWQENRWPNPYFDPAFYRAHNPGCAGDPLLHYIGGGEAAGARPVLHFDPAWYRTRFAVPPGELCLTHFLRRRHTGEVSPVREFDAAYYLRENPDVAAAGMDPMEHYLVQGAAEGRAPCEGFDPRQWRGGTLHANPLLGLLAWRERAARAAAEPNIAAEVRRNAQPNPDFEEVQPLPPMAERRAKLLAYYLPQYHHTAENDAWWGRGFTEWTNLGRAVPRFAGHLQPRIPRDLGHYSLDGPETLRRQIALARGAGIFGFVFYFYWFNGRRLLHKPVDALLADRSLAMPFCLMWANENWTRRWDGSEDEVLLSQDYHPRDEPALIAALARHFADSRYIRLGGRPLLMIYRPRQIPDTAATLDRWRRLWRDGYGEEPVLVMAQAFGDADPRPFGIDAAIEFPPHKLTDALPPINAGLHVLDPAFDAPVYDYTALAQASVAEPAPPYPLIKTAVPGWDNDPRRQGAGIVLHGATPALYQDWLATLIRRASEHPVMGEPVVAINAWNEWAEGAMLEPDVHWGAAFLNATARAAAGRPLPGACTRILLVGHDALDFGAQRLLLQIGETLLAEHGVLVGFLLLGGGPLEPAYRAVAPAAVADGEEAILRIARAARAAGCTGAIVNSAASIRALPILRAAGIPSVLLVHELPRLLAEKGLLPAIRAALAEAEEVVFSAAMVRDRCLEAVSAAPRRISVLPQGVAQRPAPSPAARAALRASLHVPAGGVLLLGVGYADLRKGFDLFLQTWRVASGLGPPVQFAWAGAIDPLTQTYLGAEIALAEAAGTFRFLGPRDDARDLMAAADVLLLTSREDPLPSVALEAMACGTPVVAFEETGGIPDLLREFGGGASVPLGDVLAMAMAAMRLATRSAAQREALAAACTEAFRFERYTAALLRLAAPSVPAVSVAILCCDYARFAEARLGSVFAQSHPVAEVLLLDDASSDDSVAVAERTAEAWRRRIRVVRNARRSGSVWAQWRQAAERASGDWLWIAEADDTAEPGFLAAVSAAAAHVPGVVLAFTDSRAIGEAGETLWPDHKAYYGPGVLAEDAVFEGPDFLRRHLSKRNLILNGSAVLWRRSALLAALGRCGDDLAKLPAAGDWRIYAEALCRKGARVAYVARPLNNHRRHPASVTARQDGAAHGAQVAAVQRAVARLARLSPQRRTSGGRQESSRFA